jgi:hypothetical protein
METNVNKYEKLTSWGTKKIGDTLKVVGNDLSELPDTQNHDIPDGIYTLSIIPINNTDIFLKGLATRNAFIREDYVGQQASKLNMIKSTFDSIYRTPIIVLEKKDGTYFVADGHHRIAIANEIGKENILGYIKKYSLENDKHIWEQKSI